MLLLLFLLGLYFLLTSCETLYVLYYKLYSSLISFQFSSVSVLIYYSSCINFITFLCFMACLVTTLATRVKSCQLMEKFLNSPQAKNLVVLLVIISTILLESFIMQCFNFNTRTRKDNKSVATYMGELKCFGEQFGDKLNKMVRDHLVWGVNNICMQNCLLPESKVT